MGLSGTQSLLCFYLVYSCLNIFFDDLQFNPETYSPASVLVFDPREKGNNQRVHPNVLNARDMAAVLYVLDELPVLTCHLPDDELTRGVRHIVEDEELSIPF